MGNEKTIHFLYKTLHIAVPELGTTGQKLIFP